MIDYKNYTVIGIGQVSKPTPTWVKKTVAVFMVAMGALSNWAYATTLIPENIKPEVLLATGTLTAVVAGVAPFFGIKTKAVRK